MWRDTQGYNEELFRILGVRNVISVGLDFKGKRFPTATVIMELTEEQQRQIEELNSGPRARIEKGEISELSTKIALTAVTALQKHGYDAFGGSYQDISKPVFRAIRKAAEEALASLDND